MLTGGALRTAMGDIVENLVEKIWRDLCEKYPLIDAYICKGVSCPLIITDKEGNQITESVDRHCYINGKLVAAIECKTYLDKCFMQRADSDFNLMKSSNEFKAYVVSLEDAVATSSFNFFMNRKNIDNVFYLADSKRNSKKHISRNREAIKSEYVDSLIQELEKFFIAATLD